MAYADEVLADSPLGYWRLGEASGTTAADSSGNGRNGSYIGTVSLGAPGLLVGDPSTSVDFNDTGHVEVPSASWMDRSQFTIEALIHLEAVAYKMIATRHNGGLADWRLFTNTDGAVWFQVNSSGWKTVSTPAGTITANTTHHIAVTRDATTSRIYVDGALVASGAVAYSRLGTPALRIGYDTVVGVTWPDRIDEVALYGSALSAARIAAHHAASTTAPPAPTGTIAATLPALTGTVTGTSEAPRYDVASYPDEVLADSPSVYWRLGDPSTAPRGVGSAGLTDASGNGRHADPSTGLGLGTPGLLVGDPDTAGDFTGASDSSGQSVASLDPGGDTAWRFFTNYTFEMIAEPDTVAAGTMLNVANFSTWFSFAADSVGFGIDGSAGQASAAAPVTAGTRYHLAGTFDGANLRLYVDGELKATTPYTGTRLVSGSADINIGVAKTSDFYDGRLDEIAIYPTALSAARILDHYHASIQEPPTDRTATLAGSLGALAGAISATAPAAPTDATLAASLPSIRGELAGEMVGAVVAVETSTRYANDGYSYDGTAAVYFEPPIAEPPAHIRRAKVIQVHQSMSAPVLVNGRPT